MIGHFAVLLVFVCQCCGAGAKEGEVHNLFGLHIQLGIVGAEGCDSFSCATQSGKFLLSFHVSVFFFLLVAVSCIPCPTHTHAHAHAHTHKLFIAGTVRSDNGRWRRGGLDKVSAPNLSRGLCPSRERASRQGAQPHRQSCGAKHELLRL